MILVSTTPTVLDPKQVSKNCPDKAIGHVTKSPAYGSMLIGMVESLLTRRTSQGDIAFLLLKGANGRLLRGKWPSHSECLLPNLGDTIRLQFEGVLDSKTVAFDAKQHAASPGVLHPIQDKTCHTVHDWQLIQTPYPLAMLEDLYRATEQVTALDRLWRLIHDLPVVCLRDWLFDLFAQPAVNQPFVQVPASYSHHHSHAGGLLLHSVECAEWVAQVATETLNDKEAALAITAALLHDFGKIETLRAGNFNPTVAHEVLTLTLLEPALLNLQKTWPQGAYALRQMLSWSSHYEKFPRLPGTVLVKMADQFSTALSARNKAFQDMPAYYHWAKLPTNHGSQQFNRIN